MTPTLLLLGAGGHARACIDVIEEHGGFEVAGLVGLPSEVGGQVGGYPVLGTDADLPDLLRTHTNVLVTVGQIKTAVARVRLFYAAAHFGAEAPVIVSPRAHVSRQASVAAGTIVMHGAVVNAGAVVGRNCIINSLALVEHDVVVGDHCHISTAAAINSGVTIGDGTFIGSQACVRQGLRIGAGCVIGMGERVLKNCDGGEWLPTMARHT